MHPNSPLPVNDSRTPSWAEPSSPSCVADPDVVDTVVRGRGLGRHASTSTLGTSISSFFSKDDDHEEDPYQRFNMSNIEDIHQLEVLAAVGQGPMRFGPVCHSTSVQEDLMKCQNALAMERYIKLQLACEHEGLDKRYTDKQIFRVASYKEFRVSHALRLLKRMNVRFLNTTVRQLEDQLRTRTLFPLPQLQSDTISSFFYMRPSRYSPNVTPTPTIIANLIYVMDTLWERHRDYNHKIGFIANMNDWTMQHFAVDYCFQFMQALQGRTAPVNVDLVSCINAT